MPTRRERIISLLEERDYSPSELARALDLRGKGSVKIILEDLKAIQKIVKRERKVLLIKPAVCRNCGFVFKPEIKIPSRCPRCKSEWIEEPRFKIERR
ncbi:transcriptional regulator [Thermococcus stetteri]|uniref:transcriptional regulator n=1 Tax=Thermococcus stetteri TaxID=49900 RepID=UPI001AEAA02E|nr:transcriptional regulator [Thermococcus stetteri]MBP1912338.1 putative Zn-ribbon and HTH transcriptional regulator [Thermococcus stetteri]